MISVTFVTSPRIALDVSIFTADFTLRFLAASFSSSNAAFAVFFFFKSRQHKMEFVRKAVDEARYERLDT